MKPREQLRPDSAEVSARSKSSLRNKLFIHFTVRIFIVSEYFPEAKINGSQTS